MRVYPTITQHDVCGIVSAGSYILATAEKSTAFLRISQQCPALLWPHHTLLNITYTAEVVQDTHAACLRVLAALQSSRFSFLTRTLWSEHTILIVFWTMSWLGQPVCHALVRICVDPLLRLCLRGDDVINTIFLYHCMLWVNCIDGLSPSTRIWELQTWGNSRPILR